VATIQAAPSVRNPAEAIQPVCACGAIQSEAHQPSKTVLQYPSQQAMAIPVAFAEARDKLQRTRQQGDRATQGVQRKRDAPLAEVVQFDGKVRVAAGNEEPRARSQERRARASATGV